MLQRFQSAQKIQREAGFEKGLQQLVFSEDQINNDELEPLNRADCAFRLPYPFLEDEVCSVYEQRPST